MSVYNNGLNGSSNDVRRCISMILMAVTDFKEPKRVSEKLDRLKLIEDKFFLDNPDCANLVVLKDYVEQKVNKNVFSLSKSLFILM